MLSANKNNACVGITVMDEAGIGRARSSGDEEVHQDDVWPDVLLVFNSSDSRVGSAHDLDVILRIQVVLEFFRQEAEPIDDQKAYYLDTLPWFSNDSAVLHNYHRRDTNDSDESARLSGGLAFPRVDRSGRCTPVRRG